MPISVALCGIGGYGTFLFDDLFAAQKAGEIEWVAAIDPMPQRCHRLAEIQALGIPIYPSLESFHAAGRCDLTIIATPIYLHAQQTCAALAHGSHVLCEKPLCATLEEMERMVAAEKASGLTVSIGYQWSFSPAIHSLKEDILAGRFGAPRRLRTITCWPRSEAYYGRNRWAGKIKTEEGEWVFDSPVNNATAHYLHNMLFLLGPSMAQSALPEKIEAELWRANPIENFDSAALRITTEGGAEILFYTSHVTREDGGPISLYEFEKGTVEFGANDPIVATFIDGEKIDYGLPSSFPYNKITHAINSARTGCPPICGIEAASAHTVCVNRVQSFPIHNFAPTLVQKHTTGTEVFRYVEGLYEAMFDSYNKGLLFSEAGHDFS